MEGKIDQIKNKGIGNTAYTRHSGKSVCSGKVNDCSQKINDAIKDHPCYSEDAHHRFARMHLAVAPACNIQCNYCNRKYDCSNESRPGITSELLTPEQAIEKTHIVSKAIPQLSVIGIAGPGDPLANPRNTFETLEGLAKYAPKLKLCLSTNGLALPEYVDRLISANVNHVTITINSVDAEIGSKIYPWIILDGTKYSGEQAAEKLIENQQRGLEMLVRAGVLVKINSVLIPGVNDNHIQQISKVVSSKGAFVHNIVPLIARPEHGSYYGLTGQREPTKEELQKAQKSCSGNARVMRHCRQCRADAVGFLNEDRSNEFALNRIDIKPVLSEQSIKRYSSIYQNNFRVAVASSDRKVIDQHFGQVESFLIYDVSADGVKYLNSRAVKSKCKGSQSCENDDSNILALIHDLSDINGVLCAGIGYKPWHALQKACIVPNGEYGMKNIETALLHFYKELLKNQSNEETTTTCVNQD